jgi:hypothetical protein
MHAVILSSVFTVPILSAWQRYRLIGASFVIIGLVSTALRAGKIPVITGRFRDTTIPGPATASTAEWLRNPASAGLDLRRPRDIFTRLDYMRE